MTKLFASARLLLLLFLPGIFGCQMTRCIQDGSIVPEKEKEISRQQISRNTPAELKGLDDKIAYSIGLDAGTDLQKLELNINSTHYLLQGIKDSLLGNEPLLSVEERQQMRATFLSERAAVRSKQLGPQAEKNLAAGNQFLRENARKEGVESLPSGLQYRVLKKGTGASPKRDQKVTVHYVVKSLDGAELENTYASGKPAMLKVGEVIPAWIEAFQLMKEGDMWELFAPAVLAYGEKGVGEAIGPFQTVIFEVELIAIR